MHDLFSCVPTKIHRNESTILSLEAKHGLSWILLITKSYVMAVLHVFDQNNDYLIMLHRLWSKLLMEHDCWDLEWMNELLEYLKMNQIKWF